MKPDKKEVKMNTKRKFFLGIIFLLFAPPLLSQDFKKEIPVEEAMKAFCGTWYSEVDYGCQKGIWMNNGTYEWFRDKSGTKPDFTGTFKIEKAWKDQEGNIFFTVWRSYKGNSWTLSKISNSGTVLELNRYLDVNNPPSKIYSEHPVYWYFKFTKKKVE
jgi:hypothetical protein